VKLTKGREGAYFYGGGRKEGEGKKGRKGGEGKGSITMVTPNNDSVRRIV